MADKKSKPPIQDSGVESYEPTEPTSEDVINSRKKNTRKKVVLVIAVVAFSSLVLWLMLSFTEEAPQVTYDGVAILDLQHQASEYEQQGKTEAALESYSQLIDETDDEATKAVYYIAKSAIVQRANNPERAIDYVERSLEIHENASGYISLASLLVDKQEFDGAIQNYERALTIFNEADEVEQDEIDFIENQIRELKDEVEA